MPSGLSLTAGNGQVAVSWTAVNGAMSYTVYYSRSPITSLTALGVTAVPNLTATSHTVTGLPNSTPFFFRVTATNVGGESSASSEVAATSRRQPADEGWGRGSRPVINVSREDAQAYANHFQHLIDYLLINVSREDAQAYAAWLSAQTGKNYRLPSESEWEYAARAGTTTAYSWGNEIGVNRANCDGCGSAWDDTQTAPVGSFAANAFGLFDMHGNVEEWVEDCYDNTYTGAPSDGSARSGCGASVPVVVRGGSWFYVWQFLRSAFRFGYSLSNRGNNLGFRLVQDLDP